MVKNLPANAGDAGDTGLIPWVRKILWSRKWRSNPIFMPGKFHGQRSLAGCSPWGHIESDITKHTHTHLLLKLSGYKECNLMSESRRLNSPAILALRFNDILRNRSGRELSFAKNCGPGALLI